MTRIIQILDCRMATLQIIASILEGCNSPVWFATNEKLIGILEYCLWDALRLGISQHCAGTAPCLSFDLDRLLTLTRKALGKSFQAVVIVIYPFYRWPVLWKLVYAHKSRCKKCLNHCDEWWIRTETGFSTGALHPCWSRRYLWQFGQSLQSRPKKLGWYCLQCP